MTTSDILLIAIIGAFIAWIVWEIRRAPYEDFDRSDYAKDDAAADQCIEASRPAPLDRPHVRAFSEPKQ